MHKQTNEPDKFENMVIQAFRLLPILRKVFLLCDVRGFTVARAAAILGISPDAVTTRLIQARREMNLRMEARQT